MCVWCVTGSRIGDEHDPTRAQDTYKQNIHGHRMRTRGLVELSLSVFSSLSVILGILPLMGNRRPGSGHGRVPSNTFVVGGASSSEISQPTYPVDWPYGCLSRMQGISHLQKGRPLHLGYHMRHKAGVEFLRVGVDLGGLEVGREAMGPRRPHM